MFGLYWFFYLLQQSVALFKFVCLNLLTPIPVGFTLICYMRLLFISATVNTRAYVTLSTEKVSHQ